MKSKVARGIQSLFILLIAIPAFAGGSGDPCDRCKLSPERRRIIEEGVARAFQDATWSVGQTHGGTLNDRGFANNLMAWSNAQLSVVTLAEQCVAPKTYDPFCEECEPGTSCAGHSRCFQLGCEANGIESLEAWWMPAPIRYTADLPPLKNRPIEYRTEPRIRFLYDTRSEGSIRLTWTSAHQVTVDTNTEQIDATSVLTGSGEVDTQGPEQAQVQIRYGSLACEGDSIVQTLIHIDRQGRAHGEVLVENTKAGTIVQSGNERPRVRWRSACRNL